MVGYPGPMRWFVIAGLLGISGCASQRDPAGPSDASASPDTSVRSDAQIAIVAPVFDGTSGYVEIPDADAFSQVTTGELTVEAWMRPDSLAMPSIEGSGYVHWLGKGTTNQHEWLARMYQAGNSEGRANRISFYAFNATGGLGAGSYFQDVVATGTWIHYAGSFDATTIMIYRDGVLRDSDALADYSIVPTNASAPVRVGTRDLASFFQGSISRVAVYNARLDATRLLAHVAARTNGNYDAVVLAEPSLVAYYRLDETSGTVAKDALGLRDGTYHAGVSLGATRW
jgi:hypothetical protein